MSAPANSAPLEVAAALERLPVAIAATARAGTIDYANAHFCRLVGLAAAPTGVDIAHLRTGATSRVRVDMRAALLTGEMWQAETALMTAQGVCHVLESAYPVPDAAGRVVRIVHFFHELAVLRQVDALGRLAFYDALTALPNRSLFEERMIAAIAPARRSHKPLAVVYTDVEHFNCVNLVLDRDAGDTLLRLIALRMQHTLRASDAIARIESDEFAVLLNDVSSPAEALRTAEKLRRACSGWYEAAGHEYSVTLSVGVGILTAHETAQDLLTRAQAAMYRDKAARRDGYDRHARFIGTRYPLDR
jgi:diguanylate cyclase (GGDEF)-like protein